MNTDKEPPGDEVWPTGRPTSHSGKNSPDPYICVLVLITPPCPSARRSNASVPADGRVYCVMLGRISPCLIMEKSPSYRAIDDRDDPGTSIQPARNPTCRPEAHRIRQEHDQHHGRPKYHTGFVAV